MATYDLEEQEQIEELKTWWKINGRNVILVIAAVLTFVIAWQGWAWWMKKQATDASVMYFGIQQAYTQQDAKRARELADQLIEKYSGTAYAGMGALLSARLQSQAGDLKSARSQLAWAAENAKDEAQRDISRLRLATLMLDGNEAEAALKQLATEPSPAFAARYAEIRGDAFVAQGKKTEARAAYEGALAKYEEALKAGTTANAAYRDMLQAKLESLGDIK